MTEHPITPPPELVQQWRNLPEYVSQLRTMYTVTITTEKLQDIATQAARWGADQELEACCKALDQDNPGGFWSDRLRAARRPKPPSLKEQALAALDDAIMRGDCITISDALPTLRRALEQLDD